MLLQFSSLSLSKSCYYARVLLTTSLYGFLLNVISHLQWGYIVELNIFFVLLSFYKCFWTYPSGERQWHYTEANSQRYLNRLLDECMQMPRWQLAGVYSFIFKCWTMHLIYLLCVPMTAFNLLPAMQAVLSQIYRQ